jgi:hypothetical protein
MKTHSLLQLLTAASVLALGTSAGFAIPNYTDITVKDGNPAFVGLSTPSGEDNEVEPNAGSLQSYDLERVIYNSTNKNMTIFGGYNFLLGADDPYRPGRRYNMGDIWIDTTSGTNALGTGGADQYQVMSGNGGYEFVIHFYDRASTSFAYGSVGDQRNDLDFGKVNSLAYQIYDLRSGSISYWDVYFSSLNGSSPFIYNGGGTARGAAVLNPGTFSYTSATDLNNANSDTLNWDPVTNWGAAYGADNHYGLTVDLSPITTLLGVNLDEAKFTMGCGNDMIRGDFTKGNLELVPDGGVSVVMISLGLSVLGLALRRKQ